MYILNHMVLNLLKEFITLGINNILHHNFSVFSCHIESWHSPRLYYYEHFVYYPNYITVLPQSMAGLVEMPALI